MCWSGQLDIQDVNEFAFVSARLELHPSVNQGEEGVVFAQSDIEPGFQRCSALPYQDRSCGYGLAVSPFDSESLGITVAAVF